MKKNRRDIIIGEDRKTGKEITLGEFQDTIKKICEKHLKRPVKVGSLIIKEEVKEVKR